MAEWDTSYDYDGTGTLEPQNITLDVLFEPENLNYIVGGFLLVTVIAVVLLGIFFGNTPSARIRRNKARNQRPARSTTNELGSGDLARIANIQQWLKRKDKYDTLLPVRDLRGSDGMACKQGYLVFPREERNRHILIIAKTGSGKTTRMVLPVLYSDCMNKDRSTIVLDSKPEMWDLLVGMTRKYNPEKRILLFNPLDAFRSLSWNILAKIETDTDAKLIANTLIMATERPNAREDSPFFRNNSLQLLNAIMVGLLNDPNETLSMPRVHELVHSGMHKLCDWLEAHPQAIRNSRTFVELARSGSQNADTILSELGMRLSAWDLRAIRAMTAKTELDLETIVREPTLFIIELRESELEMLRPMANVIVIEILRYLTKVAESSPRQTLARPVSLVIDEFASALGQLPDIHVKLNTLRSRNVSIVAAIQSIAQIKANYEKNADSVLAGFSTKILMPMLDFQDAEWASKETGTMTVRFNVSSTGKNKRMIDYWSHRNENVQEQVQQRAVLTPDEIGRPVDNVATFFLPNTPVFQGHLVPYYEVPEMVKRFDAGKGVDFQMREIPIEFDDNTPPPGAPAAAQVAGGGGLNKDEILANLEKLRAQVGWPDTTGDAHEWWLALETLNEKDPQSVVNLCNQMIARGITITEFFNAFLAVGNDNLQQIFRYIDSSLIQELKIKAGWKESSDAAREWWLAFEESNKEEFAPVIQLARELIKRDLTLDDFVNTYASGTFESIPEVMKVIDYLLGQGTLKTRGERNQNGSERTNKRPVQIIKSDSGVKIEAGEDPVVEFELEGQTNSKKPRIIKLSNASQPRAVVDVPTRKKRGVHFESCYEMATELLEQGSRKDYETLLSLIRDDQRFSPEEIEELEALGASAKMKRTG